jgi:hypothetical protein
MKFLRLIQCGDFRLTGLLCISSDVELFKKNIIKPAVWII